MKETLRNLPAVDRLIESAEGKILIERYGKPAATGAIRKAVDKIREHIFKNEEVYLSMNEEALKGAVLNAALEVMQPRLRPLINATGVIVHTNLGRAPLAQEALEAINTVASVYSNLEYDVEKCRRGSRQSLVDELLVDIIGSGNAIVVNNNAGAVFLCLMALARDREVIVSRGELVEIGGSFRIPDVMAASGAKMIEVGTTNKTRAADYADAITENTAMLLKVHRSNFYIGGFTQEASIEELAELANEKNLHLMMDLGSGCFVDTAKYGLPHEDTPREILKQGAHLVTFSGDKLLGGPQAGIIAGRSDLISTLKKHPVHRAMRVDKCNIAALEATLKLYLAGKEEESIPVIAMIAEEPAVLKRRAGSIAKKLKRELGKIEGGGFEVDIVECMGKVGGGALAEGDMPSWAVSIEHRAIRPEKIFAALLATSPPLVARILEDRLLIDVRTLWNVDDKLIINIVTDAIKAIIDSL